jgi:ATP-binding cassette subfamily C protein
MKYHKRTLIWGNIIAILATIISIPIPLLIPLMVDEVLLKKGGVVVDTIYVFIHAHEPLVYIGIVLVVTIALRFIFFLLSVISQRFFIALSQELSFSLRVRALEHLKHVSMSAYEALGSGKVITHLITDIDTIELFLSSALSRLVVSVATLIGVAGVLIWINPLFGVLIIVFQPLILIVTRSISTKVGKLKKEQNRTIGELSDSLTQMCDLFGQIRASNKEERFVNSAIDQSKQLRQSASVYGVEALRAERYSYTLLLSGFEIFRAMGLVMVLYSDLSIGLMFAIFGYLWFMMTPLQDLLSMQYSFANAKNALARLNELLSLPTEPQHNELPSHRPKTQALSIETKNLVFGYTQNELVLKGINLSITAGSTVAIIGASGSGKSTLSQLLVGFYPPTSGDIFYNGVNSREIGFRAIRDEVFVVLQQPLMFNETLRFNLTMGDAMGDDKIWEALDIAQLAPFVRELSEGLDTQVGKMGIRLSGGQRQRLSIARMVLANPKVVIFDESTSALDVHTESALFNALQEFLREKTVIIIAHRLSTVQYSDYIYVLEDGMIAQQGTYQELEVANGQFERFVHHQR